ncbi:siderophore-interacting protein [Nakamurella leprariae]|uniref:SIP domain-containing protein n=1 Tax=Nakamurella leprariae TaxID=2803911 RepID=A0A939BXA4_9ACTN|nr:SIP domain-containing protein [Nakamurella leprariae]MBM9468353.1 SIP domain-containing protein [Nakamurella leprariae]
MVNWQRGVMRVMRIANHPVRVVAVHDFTPWYRRITFSAPAFVRQLEAFPTAWLRLWVPHPSRGDGHLSQRGYTLVDVCPDAGTFGLDFVLHEVEGPAGDWARTAAVGDEREVSITPSRPGIPDGTERVVLAGDVTALPAINSWVQALPADVQVSVSIEDGHADVVDLPRAGRDRLQWHWITPEGDRGGALAAHLATAERAGPGVYAWAAGEKSLVKAVRPVLRETLALDRAHQFTQFYWIHGRATG